MQNQTGQVQDPYAEAFPTLLLAEGTVYAPKSKPPPSAWGDVSLHYCKTGQSSTFEPTPRVWGKFVPPCTYYLAFSLIAGCRA